MLYLLILLIIFSRFFATSYRIVTPGPIIIFMIIIIPVITTTVVTLLNFRLKLGCFSTYACLKSYWCALYHFKWFSTGSYITSAV